MIASVAAAITVTTQHLGFAPVLSPSMEPGLHPGDLIITKPEPAADVRVGQVVALPVPSSPGQRYTHRVISVTYVSGKPVVRTKGDANPAPEPFSLRIDSPTVPVVVGHIPYVGRLSVLLQRPSTRLPLIAITLLAMLLAGWRLIGGLRPAREDVDAPGSAEEILQG
jgi:signal peptidase I